MTKCLYVYRSVIDTEVSGVYTVTLVTKIIHRKKRIRKKMFKKIAKEELWASVADSPLPSI